MDRREMRLYVAKRRGSKRSYLSDWEDTCVLLAWIDARLSEGQATKYLGLSRIEARERRDYCIALGVKLADKAKQRRNRAVS